MMKRTLIVLLLTGLAYPCGLDMKKLDKAWRVPDDKERIEFVDKTKFAFEVLEAPEGVMAKKVAYKEPGLLMRAPDGRGWWAFRGALKVELNGKVFAMYTTAYFPSVSDKGKIDSWAGCLTTVIVYDEDGDGRFETVQTLDSFKRPALKIPQWVTARQASKVEARQ